MPSSQNPALEKGVFPSIYRDMKGFASYLVDLYRVATFGFGNPHSYTKFLLIDAVRRRAGCKVFVETGTYYGLTSGRCCRKFDHVYTIELDEELARKSAQYLSGKNVTLIRGDALEELPKLFLTYKVEDALVFLDGHFSGGVTACGGVPEPAVVELQILAEHQNRIRAVVIDDFRSFGREPGFPTKSALLRTAEELFGDAFEIQVHLDQVILVRRS